MTGESCTRVAIKLLTNLALGRGAFLAVDTVSAIPAWEWDGTQALLRGLGLSPADSCSSAGLCGQPTR